METLTNVWNYLQTIPLETWSQIGGYLAASGIIATVLQFTKKKFSIDGKKLITGLLATFSLFASVAEYLVTHNPGSPLPEIGSLWAYVMAGAVILHRFAVSPAYYRIEAALRNFADKVDTYKAEKYAPPAPTVVPPSQPSEQPQGFAE